MPINYITKDGNIYDQALTQGLITADLETAGVELVAGGKSFTLTTISRRAFRSYSHISAFVIAAPSAGKPAAHH